jgi:hypothetical protein
MTVAGDIGVIGDANVDGSMNVGNVLLTSGSSAGSRFISGRRRYQPTQSRGVGGGGWGGCIWKRIWVIIYRLLEI